MNLPNSIDLSSNIFQIVPEYQNHLNQELAFKNKICISWFLPVNFTNMVVTLIHVVPNYIWKSLNCN